MERPPKEGKGAIALKIAEAAISAIPIVGGPLSVLSELAEPYSRRRQRWLEQLAEVVSELKDHVEDLSKPLEENDRFLTAVVHASQIAMGAHQEDKLRALRNAVRNSALKSAPDDDRQLMFLRFVDELTLSHIRVLRVFDDPRAAIEATGRELRTMGGLGLVVYHCLPELNGQGDFCDLLSSDLESRGLVIKGTSLHVTMTLVGMLTPRTTNLGKQFMGFIS
jgi:hypothetical protein